MKTKIIPFTSRPMLYGVLQFKFRNSMNAGNAERIFMEQRKVLWLDQNSICFPQLLYLKNTIMIQRNSKYSSPREREEQKKGMCIQ